jgi:predicted metalloendopeptidase
MTAVVAGRAAGVRPQDDFYQHVNGGWSRSFTLPEHQAEATMLTLLADQVQDEVAALIAGAGPGRITDLYRSFIDEEAVERRGAAAFAAGLAEIDAAGHHDELAEVLGRLQTRGGGGLLDPVVSADTTDTRDYVLVLSQAGLGLPAAALYDRPDADRLRRRYRAHVARILTAIGSPDPAAGAADVLALETALARLHGPADATGRLTAAPPLTCTAAALGARAEGFAWSRWLRGFGDVPPVTRCQLRPEPFVAAVERWWRATPLPALRHWLRWRYAHELAPFGPAAVFAENFAFYGRVLTGSRQPRPRWMRGTSFVQTLLGAEVGERYLAEHVAAGTVAAAVDLVDDLVGAYRRLLSRVRWMRPQTRAAALRKLDAMVFEIGAPSRATPPVPFRIDPADLVGNVERGRAAHTAARLAMLGRPVDRAEWRVPPQAVTAYYRHGLNQVVIPAAVLRPPFFDPAGDPARNFALLGSIVCHEMSHAFDSRGARFDHLGRARSWWAPADRAEFDRRCALLVAQYDGFEPAGLPGHRVSGARTVGENLADIVGVTVAQAAFAERWPGPERQRRFFEHWASMWRIKQTRGRALERLGSDRHAPGEFRCNGVLGHVPAFYAAFDVTAGDGLHIAPGARFALV